MRESRPPCQSPRQRCTFRHFSMEQLEARQLLTAVSYGDQELVDGLAADGPVSVIPSDVDLDGDIDLVIGSFRDGKVAWHENLGADRFLEHSIDSIPGSDDSLIRELIAADFDGDGDDDVAVAAYGSDRIVWYRNLGNGHFDNLATVTTETDGVRTLAAADFDADGDLDLVSGSWLDNKVAWYANDGEGNFGSQQIISESIAGPRQLRVGDIDLDGRPDVAVAFRFDDTVAWFSNEGDGFSSDSQIISTNTNGPEAIALADADGDGDLDVFTAFSFEGMVAWFENLDENGTFGSRQELSSTAEGARFISVADLDGDGDNDVVAASSYYPSNNTNWYENTDGQGLFATGKIISDKLIGPESIAIADLDGNGTPEVIVASSDDNRVSYFPNGGDGAFGIAQPVLTHPVGLGSIATADFDGDGDLDILAGSNSDNKVAWYENVDGKGHFPAAKIITTQANRVETVRAADLDGDGDLDALSASYGDDKIAWYENLDGLGNFGPQQIISRRSNGAIDLHTADLDGDGDIDVLSASAIDGIIAWYRNEDGQGSFGSLQILTRRAISAEWVSSADLDGDGDVDILSAAYGDGKIAWYENEDGNGSFSSTQTIAIRPGSVTVEATDLDNDGDLDLVTTQFGTNATGGILSWIEQTENKVFGEPQDIAIGFNEPEALAIADVDGNGVDDIVIADSSQVVWFERKEEGFSDHLVTQGNVAGVFEVTVADMDGDSDMDILSASAYDSKLALYRNQSTSGDFDGDGSVDEADIALLCAAIQGQDLDPLFDLNADELINLDDWDSMIRDILQTSAGDANLDGLFTTADLVLVFQAGEYEDDIPNNSLWGQGDWNCDGEFDSGDLVAAFQGGQFELPAPPTAAVASDLAAAIQLQDSDIQETKRKRSASS
ncbi:MAG: VCBS repeat-containing protein [Planctomycetaceae bacterium]|nr:VCBS repeat-containing protein [Planctomycetaceae bacterium]